MKTVIPCNLWLVSLRQPGKITDISKLKCSVRNPKEIIRDHDPSKTTPITDLQGTPDCGETELIRQGQSLITAICTHDVKIAALHIES